MRMDKEEVMVVDALKILKDRPASGPVPIAQSTETQSTGRVTDAIVSR